MSNDIKIHPTSDDKTDGRFRFRKYNINTFYIEREREDSDVSTSLAVSSPHVRHGTKLLQTNLPVSAL